MSLVQVDAPGEGGDDGRGAAGDAADDQLARVAGDGDVGEVGDVREGDGGRVGEGVCEGAEPGAEHQRDGGHARVTGADGSGGLVEALAE